MRPRSPHAADLLQVACPDVKLQERRPVYRGRGRLFPPFDSCRVRRTPLAYNFRLFVLAVAGVLVSQHPALAAQPVNVVNQTVQSLYVSFSGSGPITWDASCQGTMMGVVIAPGGSCGATAESTNSGSRFCASPNAPSRCDEAQDNRQTFIETTFDTSESCTWTGVSGACVSYDISLIPTRCTDDLWKKDRCAGGGGASYNLPVELTCPGQPPAFTFTCQGPTGTAWGPQHYPIMCGNPNATCIGNGPNCVNAYFYPMFDPPESKYQPVAICSGGRTLTITFLAGQ